MKLLIAAAVAASFAIAVQAHADGDNAVAPPRVLVSYADLNLTTDAGRHALDERIGAAVRRVCPDADPRDLARFGWSRACREQALAGARVQLVQLYARHELAQGSVRVTGSPH